MNLKQKQGRSVHGNADLTGDAARQDRRDRLARRQLQAAHEHAHVVDALQREQRRPLPPDPAGGARLACGAFKAVRGDPSPLSVLSSSK